MSLKSRPTGSATAVRQDGRLMREAQTGVRASCVERRLALSRQRTTVLQRQDNAAPRHRCSKTEAAGPFRTRHASTRRECVAAPRFPPRLACQAPPGPTTSALQAPAAAPVDPFKRFSTTTSALQPRAVVPAGPCKRFAKRGHWASQAMRLGPFASQATGASRRSGSWGWAGLGTRSAASMHRGRRPVACARVTSPARPRGPGLAAKTPGSQELAA